MKKTIKFIQKETLKTYRKRYSQKYIKKNLLPLLDFVLLSKEKNFLISGSQGIGKTSLLKIISSTLNKVYGRKVLSLSLDDYYLSKKSRLKLAAKEHKLLLTRGVPGTHQIKKLISDIKKYKNSTFPIETPIFDKLIDDTLKRKKIIRTKSDILFLEGWCCGCNPIDKDYLHKNINLLERKFDKDFKWRNYFNTKLKKEYKDLFDLFDNKIFLKAPSFKHVSEWRFKQELNNSSTSNKSSKMSLNEIKIFTQYYEKITKWMLKDYTKSADLVINIDKNQKIVLIKNKLKESPFFN